MSSSHSSLRGGYRQTRIPGLPRGHRHVVKVSDEVESVLLAKAARRGISVSRLLVESALAGGADVAERDAIRRSALASELFRVSRLVGKIGVNVNQIARATNATLEEQPDAQAAFIAIQRVCARVERILDELGPR